MLTPRQKPLPVLLAPFAASSYRLDDEMLRGNTDQKQRDVPEEGVEEAADFL